MATVYEKASFGKENIVDLVNSIKSQNPRKSSKERISQLEENIKMWEERNKKANNRASYLRSKIKKGKSLGLNLLSDLDELDRIKNYQASAHTRRVNGVDIEVVIQKTNISHLKNALEKAKGNDYYYIVQDGFNKYKVKRSKILKMKNNSFFLNKMRKGTINKINELKIIKDKTPENEKRIKVLEEKLLIGIDFNKKVDRLGDKEINELDKETKDKLEAYFNKVQGLDTAEKLITLDLTEDSINI